MLSRSSDRESWGSQDPLSSVLLDLRLEGTFFCSAQFDEPWSLAIPERDFASFHFIAKGESWLQLPERRRVNPVRLEAGDLSLVPRSPRQVLASAKRTTGTPVDGLPLRRLTETVSTFHPGREPVRWHVVCGGVRFEGFAANMLLNLLPDIVVLRGVEADPIVANALAAMTQEAQAARAGSATLMTRLADVIVIHALRSWIQRARVDSGLLAALHDPEIGPAMAEVHQRPEASWSVETLAHLAHLSRSRFSERFTELMGTAPMQYVTRVRMHRARELLRERKLTIGELAARLGYQSEPAFARAFKRHVGMAPGAVRRSSRM